MPKSIAIVVVIRLNIITYVESWGRFKMDKVDSEEMTKREYWDYLNKIFLKEK